MDSSAWREPPLDYLPSIARETISWPNGGKLAFIVYVNVEHFRYDAPSPVGLTPPQLSRVPDVINWAWREYGNRVGIWRIIELLERYDIRGTAATNSQMCQAYPQIVEECLMRDWEILDHGITNSLQMYGLEADAQRAIVRESVRTIEQFTGKKPRGWSGPGLAETFDTLQILWEEGFDYVAEWGICDDLPFSLKVGDGRLLAMPYPQETNDLPVYLWSHRTTEEAYQQFVSQFQVLHRESEENGKIFSLALHPYLSGVPQRIEMLDRFLKFVTSYEDVWFATAGEVDTWYRQQ